jgi:hypothetical protein
MKTFFELSQEAQKLTLTAREILLPYLSQYNSSDKFLYLSANYCIPPMKNIFYNSDFYLRVYMPRSNYISIDYGPQGEWQIACNIGVYGQEDVDLNNINQKDILATLMIPGTIDEYDINTANLMLLAYLASLKIYLTTNEGSAKIENHFKLVNG